MLVGVIYPPHAPSADVLGFIDTACAAAGQRQTFRYRHCAIGAWGEGVGSYGQEDIWVFWDGELHNRDALAQTLNMEKSVSEGAILAKAYSVWQEKCFEKLEGRFALVIFDKAKEVLLITRDAIGQKPLYWTSQGNYWLFSTHLKGLLSAGIVPQTPSIEGLASYLHFGFVPQDGSIICGVNKLLPGHYLKVDLNGHVLLEQFWSLSGYLENSQPISREEAEEGLHFHLKKNLPSYPSVGILNGHNWGSHALSQLLTQPKMYDTPSITPLEALNTLPALVWHLDEPIADLQAVRTWRLAQLAASHSGIVVSESGWEEVLGGSSRYFEKGKQAPHTPLAFFLAKTPFKWRKSLFSALKWCAPNYKYRVLRNIDICREQVAYLTQSAIFNCRTRKKAAPSLFGAFEPEVFAQRFHRLSAVEGHITPSLYFDTKTKLPDSTLFQHDRLFGAWGIKLLNPYLDLSLVRFLAGIPEAVKFKEGKPACLLQSIVSTPLQNDAEDFFETWRGHPAFREAFLALTKGLLVEEGFISARWIKQQLGYPYIIPHTFQQLWALLILEIWFRLFINHPITASPPALTTHQLLSE